MYQSDSTAVQTTSVSVPGPKSISVWKKQGIRGKRQLIRLLMACAFSKDIAQWIGTTVPPEVMKIHLMDLFQYLRT